MEIKGAKQKEKKEALCDTNVNLDGNLSRVITQTVGSVDASVPIRLVLSS